MSNQIYILPIQYQNINQQFSIYKEQKREFRQMKIENSDKFALI